jgi:predicted alpha/beta hydrolase family esterase
MKKSTLKERLMKKYLPKMIGALINALSIVAPMKAGKLALDIFCTPRGAKLKDYQLSYLEGAKYMTIPYKIIGYNSANSKKSEPTIEDVHIQVYRWSGGGTKVLLCHGWESNAWRWRKLIKELQKKDCDIYAMDGPAHGLTGGTKFTGILYADMIHAVSNACKPSVLIGHSIGSFACLYYKAHYQSTHIEKLLLLASPDKMTDITQTYHNTIGLNARARKAYLDYFATVFPYSIGYYSAANFARQLSVGGALIHDSEDTINLYTDGVAISSSWKNCAFYTTRGHGHSLQHQDVFNIVVNNI